MRGHDAAWIGLVPRQHSTGGKQKLGGISKQGDRYLRRLLIVGATTVIRHVRAHPDKHPWLIKLLAKMRPRRSRSRSQIKWRASLGLFWPREALTKRRCLRYRPEGLGNGSVRQRRRAITFELRG
jgi:hypothetical protein